MKLPELTHSRTCGLLLMLLILVTGCATTVPIDTARRNFSNGELEAADQSLAELPHDQNAVMNLMERGMIRHLRRDFTNSTADWLTAVRLEKELETHSITKAGASMVVNDSALAFRGYPYERTYLHVYLAKNYLAIGAWEDAGVEARSIAYQLEKLDGFPDDAFSHYLTGFCLELNGDDSNAARQYREVAKLAPDCGIDPATGRFPPPNISTNRPPIPGPRGPELVCFLDFDGQSGIIPQTAEIYANGKLLGTSRTLTTMFQLQSDSLDRMATRHAAKTLSRLAFKWALFIAASSRDENLGLLTGLLLLAMENDDQRRWETLPAKLAVARVPCPPDLKEFEVVFKGFSGQTVSRMTVTTPLHQKDRISVSLCRNYP
jgi:Flp pilus assembly protein TadD